MAKSFQVQELRYRTETSFCENINDLNSNTYAARLPLQGLPTVTLTQPRIADESMVNALHQRYPGYAGVREGELEFTVFATGHVTSTASGALTSSHWLYTLLSKGLGGGNTGDTGTDIDTGAGTPDADTIYTTANPGDFAAGSILRVGSKGDGRGDGQAAAVSTVSSQTVELLTALPGSAADEDVVYAALVAYPASVGHTDLGGTTASLAFIASNLDTGAQWHLLGCELMGLSLNLSIGSPPTLTFRYKVAWWARDADTTPSAVALATQNTGPWAGGGLFYQTVGTTTRATIAAHSLSLSLDLGLVEHRTNDGAADYQTITGYTRTHTRASLTISQLYDTAPETLWDSDGPNTTYKHILCASGTTDGKVFGFYLPKCFIDGNRPSREDVNGLTGVSHTLVATEGPTTTSDLTKSPVRFFIA